MSTWKKYRPFWIMLIVGVILILASWACQVWVSLDLATVLSTITALYWIGLVLVTIYAEKMQDNYIKHTSGRARANASRDQICHVSTQRSAEDHT